MNVVSMTEFNQHVSAITRRVVEQGETIQVTNRGRVVLRLVPEPAATDDALQSAIAGGLADAPTRQHRTIGTRRPVPLSRNLDDVLAEVNADVEL